MFTGIVEELGKVIEIMPNHLCIEGHVVMEALEISDSISINGVCLTVVAIENNSLCVDLSAETLRRTNLGFVEEGQSVNLERAVTPSTRMGGHIVWHIVILARSSWRFWAVSSGWVSGNRFGGSTRRT